MKYVKLIIKLVVSFGALYYVLYKIDFNEVMRIFKTLNAWFVFLAILFFVFSKLIAANRLNMLLKTIGIAIDQLANYKLYLMGMFYNLFLPGGIGGDGYKLYLLNKRSKTKGKWIFWTLLWDRLFGVIALILLAIALSYFVETEIDLNFFQWIFIFLIPVAVFFFIKYVFQYLSKTTINALLLSIFVQLLQLLSCFFLMRAVHIMDSYFAYLFLFLISSIVAALPISIGGMGAREITFLYGSQLLFLESSLAVSISLLFYLITAFISFWGIIYSFNINNYLKPQTTRS